MDATEFDWQGGTVEWWVLSGVGDDDVIPRFGVLSEDEAQVVYGGGKWVLDIGWYDGPDGQGELCVMVVDPADWDQPLFIGRAKTVGALRPAIHAAIALASSLARG